MYVWNELSSGPISLMSQVASATWLMKTAHKDSDISDQKIMGQEERIRMGEYQVVHTLQES